MPTAVTQEWLDAANRQDGQCGAVTYGRGGINAKANPCNSTIRGGHKLYLWDDTLYCAKHFDKARRDARN